MDVKAFRHSPSGRLVPTIQGQHAFVPNPLPPALDGTFDMKLTRLATDAERALGNLAGLGQLVPNLDFLAIPYVRIEAIASSTIEGTQTSLSELYFFETDPEKPAPRDDVREVRNYLAALNHGLDRLSSLPLSLRLTRELHERLMRNVRGGTPDKRPGDFRTTQNWIGSAGAALEEAQYVPPPPGELTAALRDWEAFLHERDRLPLLVQCALMHYQFEAIHPFLDGNGRVGRLLIILLLAEREALPQPLLYLSAYFEHHRNDYYERLLTVSRDGDWYGWLQFFLQGVLVQSEHASESASRIVNEREAYHQDLLTRKATATTRKLVDYLFIHPYFNTSQVSQALGVAFNTAQSAIDALMAEGVLEEVTGQQRNRVYLARRLIELLAENEPLYRPGDEEET